MTIEELELDIKSYNQLKRAGVNFVEQLQTDAERIKLVAPSAYEAATIRMETMTGTPYERAHMFHQRVITSGSLAAQNLFTMAKALKEMRDGKLYKVLGYSSFEEYCEKMVGMKKTNAYRYISIVENIKSENVPPVGHFGIKKLALLATLSDDEQKQVVENVGTDNPTYKQLQAEISKLHHEKDKLESEVADQGQKINALTEGLGKAQKRASQANAENARLERENKELRERPVEVAVVDNSDNERRLQETIRSLERENIRQNELMDKRYIEDRRKLEADKQREIDAIRAEYEEKLREAQAEGGEDKDKQEFKIYLVMAHDALTRLAAIAGVHTEPIYAEKVKDLLNKAGKMLEG